MPNLDPRKLQLLATRCLEQLLDAELSDRTIREWTSKDASATVSVQRGNYGKLGDALHAISGGEWSDASVLEPGEGVLTFDAFQAKLAEFRKRSPLELPPPSPPIASANPGSDPSAASPLRRYCDAWRAILHDPERHGATTIADLRLDRYVWRGLSWERPARKGSGPRAATRAAIPGEGPAATLSVLDELLKQRRIVLYDDAGMGKTAFTHKCFELLLTAEHAARWFAGRPPLVVRLEGRWPRQVRSPGAARTPVTVRQMLIGEVLSTLNHRENGGRSRSQDVDLAAVVGAEIDAALAARQVVVFLDAFDQMTTDEREYVAGLLAETNAESEPTDPDVAGCAWFLTGRAYALKPFEKQFPRQTRRLRLDEFSESEQDAYFADLADSPIFQQLGVKPLDWICRPRKNVQADLGLPLNLREIRTLIEDGLADGASDDRSKWAERRIRTSGELHALVARVLLERGLRHVELRQQAAGVASHAGEPKKTEQRIPLLMRVCGLIGLQMMLEQNYNACVDSNDLHGDEALGQDGVEAFLDRARARFLATRQPANAGSSSASFRRGIDPEEAWDWAVDVLQQIEVTHRGHIDTFNSECRSFRDRKTMEWYAAHYLMNHATEEDLYRVIEGAGPRCVRDFAFDKDWLSNCWRQAIRMPREQIQEAAALRSLGVLFSRPREDESDRLRPCEHMWRIWRRWLEPERDSIRPLAGAADLIARFRSEFAAICDDDEEPRRKLALTLRFDPVRDAPDTRLPEPNKTSQGWYRRIPPEGTSTSFQGERTARVNVSTFWLRKFVVTNAEYRLFDPHHRSNSGEQFNVLERPVVDVDWHMAALFCRWLGAGYCLPTETQWEAACRANPPGVSPRETTYWFGNDEAELARHAWFGNYDRSGNAEPRTYSLEESQQAGGHENPWGLVDMHGNVWEWCQDYYDGVGKNPDRVVRGGSWGDRAWDCRSAIRDWGRADIRVGDQGFRVCLVPGPVSVPARQEKNRKR